jgi:hypothetical protein
MSEKDWLWVRRNREFVQLSDSQRSFAQKPQNESMGIERRVSKQTIVSRYMKHLCPSEKIRIGAAQTIGVRLAAIANTGLLVSASLRHRAISPRLLPRQGFSPACEPACECRLAQLP